MFYKRQFYLKHFNNIFKFSLHYFKGRRSLAYNLFFVYNKAIVVNKAKHILLNSSMLCSRFLLRAALLGET